MKTKQQQQLAKASINYQHPDALQRVREELKRTVWPLDRKFFRKHPTRSYRLRPALDIEVAEKDLINGTAVLLCPPGMGVFVSVRQVVPGVRLRLLFGAPAVEHWIDPPEDICQAWYEHLHQRNPLAQEITGFVAAAKAVGARFD
jgi:hypothetical protein